MAGKGQPNKYYTHVEPYLDKIKEMTQNMTEKQIAQTLGVAYSSFRTYKKEHPALVDALKKGRAELVMELKSTLIQKARGFNYEEKKQVIEYGVVVREEIYTKAATPDVAALNLLLKNYDKDWRNDPAEYELKKKALELQQLKLEEGNWN